MTPEERAQTISYSGGDYCDEDHERNLRNFAAAIREAVAEERERCMAILCEACRQGLPLVTSFGTLHHRRTDDGTLKRCAAVALHVA